MNDHDIAVPIDPNAPVGTIQTAVAGGVTIVLVRHSQGWTAALDSCPHAGCSLSRMGELVDDNVLVCNCHGSEFDLVTGEVLQEPAEQPLRILRSALAADGTSLLVAF